MLGKASIHIEWNEDGNLNVYHGSDKTLLATKALSEKDKDDWDNLWSFLMNELKLKKTV